MHFPHIFPEQTKNIASITHWIGVVVGYWYERGVIWGCFSWIFIGNRAYRNSYSFLIKDMAIFFLGQLHSEVYKYIGKKKLILIVG